MSDRFPAHRAAGSRDSDPTLAAAIIFLAGSVTVGLALGVLAVWVRGLF